VSRKRLAGIVLLVVVVAAALVIAVAPRGGGVAAGGDAVAVVHLQGPIQEGLGGPLGGQTITPAFVRDQLETVEDDPSVKALVLRLDSPGGTVAASQEIAGMVRDFPTPVVVSMGDTAASGGYYVSSAADRIVAEPGTLTGSIGVIWAMVDPEQLLDRLGVRIEAVTAGKHKDMLLPGRLTPERRAILEEMTDGLYDQFVTAVAEGRGLGEDRVRDLATGQPYTGEQAHELGLVDVLGGLDEAVAEAEQLAGIEDAEVIEVRPGFLEQLFGGPGFRVRQLLDGDARLDEVALVRRLLQINATPRFSSS
jgi:protease-4